MPIKHKRSSLSQAVAFDGLQKAVEGTAVQLDAGDLKNAIHALKDHLSAVFRVHGEVNIETGDVPELVVAQGSLDQDAEWIECELDDLDYARFEDITGVELETSSEDWIEDAEIMVYGCIALALEEVLKPGMHSTISAGYTEVVSWVEGA